MVYFIFDMDETLAELYSVYYFIATLRLNKSLDNIPESLTKKLDNAYNIFVEGVLKEEKSKNPLGVLRPGILTVMNKLNELQRNEKLKNVVIYSNNGHLESLEFIRDLIHRGVGSTKLISECIHWNHHMRAVERVAGKPGWANKTWDVLRNIMINGNCKASTNISPMDVYFFDDLDHPDLQRNLGGNYFKVPGYNYKASFNRLSQIFINAIKVANINTNELMDYVVEMFVGSNNEYMKIMEKGGMDGMIELFRIKTKGTSDMMVPKPDDGISMMMEAISRVEGKIGGMKRKRGVMTRKRKMRRPRVKSRVRKN